MVFKVLAYVKGPTRLSKNCTKSCRSQATRYDARARENGLLCLSSDKFFGQSSRPLSEKGC